jgi:HEAT repeat protein
MSQQGFADDEQDKIVRMLKHLRVGVDMRAADAGGLAMLLISKGLITRDEYIEQVRLAANEELARYEAHCRKEYGLPDNADFR